MPLHRWILAVAAAAALVMFAACGGGNGGDGDGSNGDNETPSASEEPEVTPTASPTSQLCPKVDDEVVQAIVAALEITNNSFEQGQPIEMTVRLTNCADDAIAKTFPSAQRYDFVAKTEAGDELWRWSHGMAFAQTKGEETMEPGEQVTFTETWDQTDNDGNQVPAGAYQITGESTGCDENGESCGPSALRFIEITAAQ